MARLGIPAEARDVLAPVYAWFPKGCAAPELKEAKALINELSDLSIMLLLPGPGRLAPFRNFDDAQKTLRRCPTGISDCVPRFRHSTTGLHRGPSLARQSSMPRTGAESTVTRPTATSAGRVSD